MKFNELTDDQKASLLNFDSKLLRSVVIQCAKTLNLMGAMLNDAAAHDLTTVLGALDAGELIPYQGGLDGAISLTKEDFDSLIADFTSIYTTYNTADIRQRFARAAGTQNLI